MVSRQNKSQSVLLIIKLTNTCSLVLTSHLPPSVLLQTNTPSNNTYDNLDFVLSRYVPRRALTLLVPWSEAVISVPGRTGRTGEAASPPRSLATAVWATETQRRTAVIVWRRGRRPHSPAWLCLWSTSYHRR